MNNIKNYFKDELQTSTPLIGGMYEHYKGNIYKVLMIVFNAESDNLEPWVVYQGLYADSKLGNEPVFTRSVAAFMENVEVDGRQVRRFTLID